MIIKNEDSFGNSDSDYKFFIDHYEKILPIKHIQVFFLSSNFLLTDYNVDNGTTFVAEGWNKSEIHLTGINCGYLGKGPSTLAKVLCTIGVSEEQAQSIKTFSSVELYFDKVGVVTKIKKSNHTFFGNSSNNSVVSLDEHTFVEFDMRKIFFINPQFYNMNSVYSAIKRLKPYEFQYYIGDNSPLFNSYRLSSKPIGKALSFDSTELLTGINLILRCDKIDMMFLVDKRIVKSFVNVIHYNIYKEPLFDENIDIEDNNIKLFLKILFSKSEPLDGVKEIRKRNKI